MLFELTKFKVIYKEKVLRALGLISVIYDSEKFPVEGTATKPKFIEILALNEDGNIVNIYDEAWMFQFIPIVGRE